MRRIGTISVLGAIVALLISGCGPQKLTRASAEKLLNEAGAKKPITKMTVSAGQLLKLAHMSQQDIQQVTALMNIKDAQPCLTSGTNYLGPTIRCPGYIPADAQKGGGIVTLAHPIGWKVVDITGISDSANPSEKTVEYTWLYDLSELPKAAADVLNPNPPAAEKASFRLYDDGWRFVEPQ